MVPALAQAQAMGHQPTIAGTRLDVTAEGEVRRKPDIAEITAGVTTQATTATQAMRDNSQRMAAVIAALKKSGVAERDIQTASISLSPQYRYGENQPPQLVGYQASNQVQVRFRDIARSGSVLDALVSQGANQVNGPSFTLDDPESALDEARTAAIVKARQRANLYASAAGLKVKRILAISEAGQGAPPPYPMPAMRMAAAKESADTAIEPGESKLTVSVNVSFELE
jgi:hypothetical protein